MSRNSGQYSYISAAEPRPSENTSPASPYSERPSNEMATLPPPPSHIQTHDPYRAHTGYAMYSPSSQAPMSYPPPSANSSQPAPPNFPSQPAPRQRTAIACRYCRRRKIRCHGFDSSPDGRCTNCLRFHQECIFTPVSSQAHAFVPAHTAYPHLRNNRVQTGPDGRPLSYSGQPGPPLYGAHGQPLGPVGHHDANYSQGPPPAPYAQNQYQSQALPPQQPGPPSMHYDERSPPQQQDHRVALSHQQRRGSSSYEYPDPTHMAPSSPASSAASYQAAAYANSTAQPYYQTTNSDRRTSPTATYFAPRASGSPHGSNATILPPLPAGLHPPQSLPSAPDGGRIPSPIGSGPRTGALSVADMLTPTSATRSTTDSDMLNALNRKRR